jgi:beta-mannosidase
MSSCGKGGTCFVKNDMPLPFHGTVTITSYAFDSGNATVLATKPVSLAAGPGVTEWFDVNLPTDPSAEILTAVVSYKSEDSGETETWSDNLIPLTAPSKMALLKANVKFTVATAANVDGTVDITVTTDKVAVYVTLTTLANGRFSDNAFLLLPTKPMSVQFLPFGELDTAKLQSSLRVEHVASYQ